MKVDIEYLQGLGSVKVLKSDKGEVISIIDNLSDDVIRKIINTSSYEKGIAYERGLEKGAGLIK